MRLFTPLAIATSIVAVSSRLKLSEAFSIKNIISRWAFVAAAFLSLNLLANAAPAKLPSFDFNSIAKKEDELLLQKVMSDYLLELGRSMPIPDRVVVVNSPQKGPLYDFGVIMTKYPFFRLKLDPVKDETFPLTKGAMESIRG